MSDRQHIVELSRTTMMHPTQWEGMLADGRPVFIRYKWGALAVRIGEAGESMGKVVGRVSWFEAIVANWSDPMIELRDVLRATGMTIAQPLEPLPA